MTNELDFTMEFSSETLSRELEYALFAAAERELQSIAKSHTDLTGAAINIRPAAVGDNPPHRYEATVVLYARPTILSATEKAEDAQGALQGALNAAVRQIRKKRERLGAPWEQPGSGRVATEVLGTASPPESDEREEP